MNRSFINLITLSISFLLSSTAFSYSNFSNDQAKKSVVLVQAKQFIGRDYTVNAIALTPNLLLATKESVSGLSVNLSINGKTASVLKSLKDTGLVLLSYPPGGLSPVTLSKSAGGSKRQIYVVRHAGDAAIGELIDVKGGEPGAVYISVAKSILSLTGSGLFNNCGELIGIYNEAAPGQVAAALSLTQVNKSIKEISGVVYSKTSCPSEQEKEKLEEDARVIKRQQAKDEATEALKKTEQNSKEIQEANEKALRIAEQKAKEQDEANKKALAELEIKSKENEEANNALELAKKESAEKQALADQEKLEIQAEKLAAEEALQETQASADAVEKERIDQQKAIKIGGLILGVLALILVWFLFRRSRRNKELTEGMAGDTESPAILSFDVLIRGENVGIKVPAELIARARGVVIGRSAAESDFVIDSPEVSRSHIRLSEKDGYLDLEDLGSANGTNLNAIKLQPAQLVALHDRDKLELADAVFSVEFQNR